MDPQVPYAEQLGALAELAAEGKVRHVGLSEVTVGQLIEARKTVDVASVQNLYNVTDRQHEAVLNYCQENGISFVPWLPVSRSVASDAGSAIGTVAAELGATGAQVALAWLLRRSPVMLPIPGTSSERHLEENVAAANLTLTDAQYDLIAAN